MEQKIIKAGDRVRIKSLKEIEATLDGAWMRGNIRMNKANMAQFAGQEATVRETHTTGAILDNGWYWHRDWLEPINEPAAEAAPLDLCALLAGCEGMRLYSTVEGPVMLTRIDTGHADFPVEVVDSDGATSYYTRKGCFLKESIALGGECVLFPAKDQRDWSKWGKPEPGPWKPESGEDYWTVDGSMQVSCETNIDASFDIARIAVGNCFRTREEAEEAAEELKRSLAEFRRKKMQGDS